MIFASIVTFLWICLGLLSYSPTKDMTISEAVSVGVWVVLAVVMWISIVRRERRRKAMRERHDETKKALADVLKVAKNK